MRAQSEFNRFTMGERTPRRNNNIILSAQQLDHNASMARDLNKRASNRLRLHKGNIDGYQTANLSSLDYEMRRLRHELREITHNSGTLDKMGETITRQQTMPSKPVVDTKRRKRRKSKRMVSGRNAKAGDDLSLSRSVDGTTDTQTQQNSDTARRKSMSLPKLPSMSGTAMLSPRDPSPLTSRTSIPKVEDSIDSFSSQTSSKPKKEMRRKQSRVDATESSIKTRGERKISVSITDTNGETKLRPISPRETTKEDSSFANLNLDAVKDRIHNRLSQAANDPDQSIDDDADNDPDITRYMHVPPDGLPRTVYLLPPLPDLLQEAKKARYIRRPKKPLQEMDMDDPDRELGIDEIFSKKG